MSSSAVVVGRRIYARVTRFAEVLRQAGLSEVGRLLDAELDAISRVSVGVPRKHADTHKGGDDTVIATTTPQAIGINGAAGDPANGAQAAGHAHAAGITANGDLLTITAGVLGALALGAQGRVLSAGASAVQWSPLSSLALTTWSETTPAQLTADVNDYDLSAGQIARVSSDAARTITGILAGATGELKLIVNVGAFNVILSHQDTASAEANRLLLHAGAMTLGPDEWAWAYYDGTTARWRAVEL